MLRSASLLVGTLLLVGARSGEQGANTPAQQSPPTIRTELDTLEITVGDPLSLTVTVEHDAGSSVVWPDSVDLGPFELLDAVQMEPVGDGDRVASAARFRLTAFELGELEIPSFDVTVLGADSASTAVLSTEALKVTVASVGLDESGDIKDVKGPLEMSRNWLLLLPWILAVGAAAAIGYWLYRKFRRSRQSVAELTPAAPPRPPHEIAYESLDHLESSGLLEKGEIKQYHIEVSEIIRRYLEGRYCVDALEMATYEVVQGLERAGVPFDTRVEFDRFLGDCDLVKFAKLKPEIAACREMVPRARKLVDETRESDVAPETETEGRGVRGVPVASAVPAAPAPSASPAPSATPASLPQGEGEGGRE
jgi:hypothetical protein